MAGHFSTDDGEVTRRVICSEPLSRDERSSSHSAPACRSTRLCSLRPSSEWRFEPQRQWDAEQGAAHRCLSSQRPVTGTQCANEQTSRAGTVCMWARLPRRLRPRRVESGQRSSRYVRHPDNSTVRVAFEKDPHVCASSCECSSLKWIRSEDKALSDAPSLPRCVFVHLTAVQHGGSAVPRYGHAAGRSFVPASRGSALWALVDNLTKSYTSMHTRGYTLRAILAKVDRSALTQQSGSSGAVSYTRCEKRAPDKLSAHDRCA